MKIIDLTHTITPTMPVYPGTEQPLIIDACTHEKDSFLEKKLTFYSHTGTHMDAPAHILPQAKTLDAYDSGWFFGPATVIDISGKKQPVDVQSLQKYADVLKPASFCLLYTGWSAYWGKDKYFSEFPVLSAEAAAWLSQFPLQGLGVDAISVDPVGSTDFLIHKTFLSKEMVLIENLTNLELLMGKQFEFCCLPLKIQQADGSPVRAVGILR